jgi:stage III sporulation protein AB
MRLLGALLLVCACTLLGLGQAGKLIRRRACLAETVDLLRAIDAELKNGAVPIPEIFAALESRPADNLRGFIQALNAGMSDFGRESLAELWRGCVLNESGPALSVHQRQELCRVGDYLGRYAESEQSGALAVCIARLEDSLQRAGRRAREGVRLYTGLGLSFGLMLAAVLL